MTHEEAELTILIHKQQCSCAQHEGWPNARHQLPVEVLVAVDLDKRQRKAKISAQRRYGRKARELLKLFDFHTCKKILEALK